MLKAFLVSVAIFLITFPKAMAAVELPSVAVELQNSTSIPSNQIGLQVVFDCTIGAFELAFDTSATPPIPYNARRYVPCGEKQLLIPLDDQGKAVIPSMKNWNEPSPFERFFADMVGSNPNYRYLGLKITLYRIGVNGTPEILPKEILYDSKKLQFTGRDLYFFPLPSNILIPISERN